MSFQTTASATATAPAPEPRPRNLDFYCLRDDMVRAYQPVTEEERLYVTQIARCWLRLQRLLDAESAILDQQPLPDLFASSQERFKTLHRAVAEAERMWRHAVQMFQKARSRRERTSLESPRRYSTSTVPSVRPIAFPGPQPAAEPENTERTQTPPPEPADTKRTQIAGTTVTERTQSPGAAVTKRTQTITPSVATCSPASTTSGQVVEKCNMAPVDKSKGSLN